MVEARGYLKQGCVSRGRTKERELLNGYSGLYCRTTPHRGRDKRVNRGRGWIIEDGGKGGSEARDSLATDKGVRTRETERHGGTHRET